MGPETAAGVGTALEAGGGAAATSWLTPEVSAALLYGGTAAQMLAAEQKAKQQRSILNRAFDKTQEATGKAVADVQSVGQQQGGAAQLAAVQAAQDAAAGRTMADLKGAGADLIDTAGGNGAQSQAFLAAKADRALTEGNRMTSVAREMAKVRAPGMVQQDNAMARGDLAERIGSAGATARAGTQASQLDAQNVDDPWYGSVGQLASLVGSVGMMNPSGAAGSGGMTLAPATLGEAGTAGSTGLGAVRFGDGAARAATLGGMGSGGVSSALARALPAASSMFSSRRGWAGR